MILQKEIATTLEIVEFTYDINDDMIMFDSDLAKMHGVATKRRHKAKVTYRFSYFTFKAKSKITTGHTRNLLFMFNNYINRF